MYAKQFLSQLEPIFPGITAQWNGKAMLSTPFTDPNFRCSYSYWKPGQYTSFSGYEGVRQGNIHFAGEHCSTNFQGFHGRWRLRRRPRRKRNPRRPQNALARNPRRSHRGPDPGAAPAHEPEPRPSGDR
jgi:Flavin containing amine oxidoreductase